MEIKKYPAADVRRKSDIYFMIGLIVALGITLAAFNYKSSDEIDLSGFIPEAVEEVEEMTDITRQEQPPPPPPSPVPVPLVDGSSDPPHATSVSDASTSAIRSAGQARGSISRATPATGIRAFMLTPLKRD